MMMKNTFKQIISLENDFYEYNFLLIFLEFNINFTNIIIFKIISFNIENFYLTYIILLDRFLTFIIYFFTLQAFITIDGFSYFLNS